MGVVDPVGLEQELPEFRGVEAAGVAGWTCSPRRYGTPRRVLAGVSCGTGPAGATTDLEHPELAV